MSCVQIIEETYQDIYSNWYVLHVTCGKEFIIKNTIEKYAQHSIKTTVFQREFLHTNGGKTVKVTRVLFSGYIFIYKELNTVLEISKKHLHTERIIPLSVNKKPCAVYKEEMEVLLNNSDSNGLFRLSRGKKVNDTVHITEGILKNFQGNIIWIDEKKKKAKVEIFLFQRKIKVNLGIDIIKYAS